MGQGFGARTLRRIRQFYVTYPEGSALPPELGGPAKRTAPLSKSKPEKIRIAALTNSAGVPAPFPPHLVWTHYLVLLRVTNPTARAFYEIEAARDSYPWARWSAQTRPRVSAAASSGSMSSYRTRSPWSVSIGSVCRRWRATYGYFRTGDTRTTRSAASRTTRSETS